MLLSNIDLFYGGLFLFTLFAILYAGNAYRANAQLPADDPQKRNYHPSLIVFAPVLLPVSILSSIFIFVMKVLLYGLALVLFTIVLVFATILTVLRQPVHIQLPRAHKTTALYQE